MAAARAATLAVHDAPGTDGLAIEDVSRAMAGWLAQLRSA